MTSFSKESTTQTKALKLIKLNLFYINYYQRLNMTTAPLNVLAWYGGEIIEQTHKIIKINNKIIKLSTGGVKKNI